MANGTLEAEPDFQEKAFNASFAHFNAYSKRPEIDKYEASNAVAARQMNLIRAELPHDILRRAKACVAKTPR